MPDDPGFNPSCSGASSVQPAGPGATAASGKSWIDPRLGTANLAGWSAASGFGNLHSSAHATASTLPQVGSSTPLALGLGRGGYAVAVDDIVFSGLGLAGQSATATGSVHIDGSLLAGSTSSAGAATPGWTLDVDLLDGNRFIGRGTTSGGYLDTYGVVSGESAVDQVLGFSAPVIFGKTYQLYMRLDTLAFALAKPAGSPGSPEYAQSVTSTASAGFAHTAAWNGFQSMTLADGTAASGWSVASASGLDYGQPVPEPGTGLLLLAGLGLAGLAVKHRQAARAR